MRWLRSLYDWTLSWAKKPQALLALGVLSFAESSFFPVPPDALLIAMCVGAHTKWARFALVCSLASVAGGMAGYGVGMFAYETLGYPIMSFIAGISGQEVETMIETAQYWFNEKEVMGFHVGAWAVGAAGFTPIPYKVFTISAGFFRMDFAVFVIASAISRSLRFFLVAGIIGILYRKYGESISRFIDRYFNLLAGIFLLLLIGGILVIRIL
ncbi:MAG: YqaA family protein [Candidatus Zixiibacteriota bacterium]